MERSIDESKIRERVDEYIANEGYMKERTFGPDRLGLNSFHRNIPSDIIIQNTFWDNMEILRKLKEIFEPVREIYQQGKGLYAKASVITLRYREISDIQNYREKVVQEYFEENPGFLGIKRLAYNLLTKIFGESGTTLPPKVSAEESRQSLEKLYFMLQESQEDLSNIKNHTSIVCLDQLQKEGLDLDEIVSTELRRIPQKYLNDPFIWNENVSYQFKLRNGIHFFGNGLF